jgi:hypothetical protein
MDLVWKLLPDLSVLIPDRLKPYAKAVVVFALLVIYALVTYTHVITGEEGTRITGLVILVAGALGVLGTSNVPNTPPKGARKRKRAS